MLSYVKCKCKGAETSPKIADPEIIMVKAIVSIYTGCMYAIQWP